MIIIKYKIIAIWALTAPWFLSSYALYQWSFKDVCLKSKTLTRVKLKLPSPMNHEELPIEKDMNWMVSLNKQMCKNYAA